jgi:hypothetical protein
MMACSAEGTGFAAARVRLPSSGGCLVQQGIRINRKKLYRFYKEELCASVAAASEHLAISGATGATVISGGERLCSLTVDQNLQRSCGIRQKLPF